MAEAIVIPAGATGKAVTAGTGFLAGMSMSFVTKTWPAAGIMGSILGGVIGLGGALLTRGMVSDAFVGVGAGSAAILGSAIAWLPEGSAAKTHTKQLNKGGQTLTLQLKSGEVGLTGEVAAKAAKASTLEF